MADIFFGDIRVLRVENGSVPWEAFVYEKGRWIWREVSEDEKKGLLPLLDFDLSWLKKETVI